MTWEILRLTIFNPLHAWVGGFGLLGIGLLALWWFTPSFIASGERRMIVLCAGIGCFALGGFFAYAFKSGEAHMTQLVAARNAAALQRVRLGAIEVEACHGGIDWDVVIGQCVPGSFAGEK